MKWAGYGDVALAPSDEGLSDTLFEEARLQSERGDDDILLYQRQEGVIVARLAEDQVPGLPPGAAMPTSQYLYHPGFDSSEDRQASFLQCAQELHQQFLDFSDRQFLLMDPAMRSAVTLVTVVMTPIMAVPRVDHGVELLCEFYQRSQMTSNIEGEGLDLAGFDVFSEIGSFPVLVPTDPDLAMMFTSFEEFKAMEAAGQSDGGQVE